MLVIVKRRGMPSRDILTVWIVGVRTKQAFLNTIHASLPLANELGWYKCIYVLCIYMCMCVCVCIYIYMPDCRQDYRQDWCVSTCPTYTCTCVACTWLCLFLLSFHGVDGKAPNRNSCTAGICCHRKWWRWDCVLGYKREWVCVCVCVCVHIHCFMGGCTW